MALDQVVRLRKEYFEQRPFDEVYGVWKGNHAILLDSIRSTEIPYFGLHGTGEEAFQLIVQNQIARVNMTTFYEKEGTERRLIQLYDMANYVVSYAHNRGSTGGIMVFDLESNGKNISPPWGHIVSGSFCSTLNRDSDNQKRNFESLLEIENTLWRANDTFSKKNDNIYSFAKRYKGFISMKDEKFREYLQVGDMMGIPMSILRDRIRAQYILSESLKLLSTQPTS